ncbi:MAG: hypothetical protein OXB84_02350 [Halobacteriovoraceae bacterium]|nr:hypothetical protein [Halobacteriovoraceae bacterium]
MYFIRRHWYKVALITLLLPIFNSFARRPAVLPVKGISIDQYKEVKNPQSTPGFDFSSKINPPAAHNQMVYLFSLVIISALLSMICGLLLIKQKASSGAEIKNNVLKFTKNRKKKKIIENKSDDEDDDDDQDYKKAS